MGPDPLGTPTGETTSEAPKGPIPTGTPEADRPKSPGCRCGVVTGRVDDSLRAGSSGSVPGNGRGGDVGCGVRRVSESVRCMWTPQPPRRVSGMSQGRFRWYCPSSHQWGRGHSWSQGEPRLVPTPTPALSSGPVCPPSGVPDSLSRTGPVGVTGVNIRSVVGVGYPPRLVVWGSYGPEAPSFPGLPSVPLHCTRGPPPGRGSVPLVVAGASG